MGLLRGTRRALLSVNIGLPFDLDLALTTFTAGMAKRDAPGPFAAAPIVQGQADGSGSNNDLLRMANLGTQIAGNFRPNFDADQGTIVLWWTPEFDYDFVAGYNSVLVGFYGSGGYVRYNWDSKQFQFRHHSSVTGYINSAVVNVVAGNTYCVVARWNSKNPLDGTNYMCISVNDVHVFGQTSAFTAPYPDLELRIGSASAGSNPGNGVVEGLTVYRRVLYDGTYGVNANSGVDEINAIYAAGAGKDPCLVTGSWDVVFCLPTNSTVGALATGTGEAWSHPHSSAQLTHTWVEDRYYGNQWAIHTINGAYVNLHTGATLDDLAVAGDFTVEFWVAPDLWTPSAFRRTLISKGYSDGVGWMAMLSTSGRILAAVRCANWEAAAESSYFPDLDFSEAKTWHHIAIYYNGSNAPKIAVDGKWASSYEVSYGGSGAPIADAVKDLLYGSDDAWWAHCLGRYGWLAIWSDDHYSAGTDFIPPRTPPTPGGNLVECWHVDEGTGSTLTAQVTSPGNDGTALGTYAWEQQWAAVGTPVIPACVNFDSVATAINCGSGATVDDLPSGGVVTIEFWSRTNTTTVSSDRLVSKQNVWNGDGFYVSIYNGYVGARFNCATTGAQAYGNIFHGDGKWRHFAVIYDDAAKLVKVYVDGEHKTAGSIAGVGAYVSDAPMSLFIGANSFGGENWDGDIGWVRISDIARYTSHFVPPSRANPPAIDGNTVVQLNMDEGAGTTAADSSGNANHGTITMGAGAWRNTPDMATVARGARVYQWGYAIGSDGANDGVEQHKAGLTPGADYVARIPIRYEDVNAQPSIVVYDEIGAAAITTFLGPKLTGQHTGANNSATLVCATGNFPQSLIGCAIYNITDGSAGWVDAVSGDKTTITTTLVGGTDNDWDTNDVFMIITYSMRWVWCEPFTFELPAGCTEISFRLLNTAGAGVLYWNQAEVQANLLTSPSLEAGAGNPWLPTGWSNADLDAGDTEADAATIHSGAQSMEWNPAAINEGMTIVVAGVGSGKFFVLGGWEYGDGSGYLFTGPTGENGLLQYSSVDRYITWDNANVWKHACGVERSLATNPTIGVHASSGATGDRFLDDIYMIALNDVSLTVTPASQANSLESGGIRVDGSDACYTSVPTGRLGANRGRIRWRYIPRHDDADAVKFAPGNSPNILRAIHFADATRYIYLRWNAANAIRLQYNDGTNTGNATWNTGGGVIVAGTEYLMEVRYTPGGMEFLVDNVARITITNPVNFDKIPDIVQWGYHSTEHDDAVFLNP